MTDENGRTMQDIRRTAMHGIACASYAFGFTVAYVLALSGAPRWWITPCLILGWALLVFLGRRHKGV